MKLILAPMHGLTDYIMRQTLTQIGGYDECVSEFVRITHTIHSPQAWLRNIPELNQKAKTTSGTHCTIQLLGSNLDTMAQNARNAALLGATKIDLNFGCPAKNVNDHRGGAILLKEPETIFQITQAVSHALPKEIILSTKMRLGYEDKNLAVECAQAMEAGGSQVLTVHARTKAEGYTPPAHWDYITQIKNTVNIPIVANGDIFSLGDYKQIKQQTNCDSYMLGRGALMCPDLARQIKMYENQQEIKQALWSEIQSCLYQFFIYCQQYTQGNYPISRLKQWLGMLQKNYPEAQTLFSMIKTKTTIPEIELILLEATI